MDAPLFCTARPVYPIKSSYSQETLKQIPLKHPDPQKEIRFPEAPAGQSAMPEIPGQSWRQGTPGPAKPKTQETNPGAHPLCAFVVLLREGYCGWGAEPKLQEKGSTTPPSSLTTGPITQRLSWTLPFFALQDKFIQVRAVTSRKHWKDFFPLKRPDPQKGIRFLEAPPGQSAMPEIRPGAPWPWHCRRRFSPLRRREGPRHLPATHLVPPKSPAFYGVSCPSHFFHFFGLCGSRWVNMGQHRPQDGPT